MSAADIARGLDLKRHRRGYIGRCPSCRYEGAFTVEDRDGTTLVRCHVGCEQRDIIDALRRLDLWGRCQTHERAFAAAKVAKPAKADDGTTAEWALALWNRAALATLATLAAPNPVGRYLAHRGYTGPIPPSLRHLPGAKHTPTGTTWPAMIAAVTRVPGRAITAVHRTYLRPDGTGKAPVKPEKMTLGPTEGGAVRLADAGEQLAVTEGIETGLAVLAATGVPTWAALSAGGIRSLVLPPLPLAAEVTICADHDPVGIAAAATAAERWYYEGRQVRIALPPEPDTDFNDLVQPAEGPS